MKKKERKLTKEQIEEINSYPNYWRPTLTRLAKEGESIKEMYEELKTLEDFL